MRDRLISVIFILIAAAAVLVGCSAESAGKALGEELRQRLNPASTENSPDETISTDLHQAPEDGVYSYQYADLGCDGYISVVISNARIIRNKSELPEPENFEKYAYSSSGGKTDWNAEVFLEDGSMRDDVYMVLLDVTADNPDGATNRITDEKGRYKDAGNDNIYLFRASELCYLMERGEDPLSCIPISVEYCNVGQDSDGYHDRFELREGETKSFQIGFFVGLQTDIIDNEEVRHKIAPEDLMLLVIENLPDAWEYQIWEMNLQ